MKVFMAEAEPGSVTEVPGTVVGETGAGLRVAAGNGTVLLQELQLEGKKRMGTAEFLRGFRISGFKAVLNQPA